MPREVFYSSFGTRNASNACRTNYEMKWQRSGLLTCLVASVSMYTVSDSARELSTSALLHRPRTPQPLSCGRKRSETQLFNPEGLACCQLRARADEECLNAGKRQQRATALRRCRKKVSASAAADKATCGTVGVRPKARLLPITVRRTA